MAKRGSPTIPKAGGGGASPLFSASVVVIAIGYGAILLVQKGRLSWPPYELLGSAFTLFGCLGLVGPVILARRESGQAYLGELVWFACGMLIWMHDLALLARGEWRASAWATPMSYQSLGLASAAIMVAGWRCGIAAKSWNWTNLLGLLLAAFWIGMGMWTVGTSMTTRPPGLVRSSGSLDGRW